LPAHFEGWYQSTFGISQTLVAELGCRKNSQKIDIPVSIPVKKEDDDKAVVHRYIQPGFYSVRCVMLEHQIGFIDRYV